MSNIVNVGSIEEDIKILESMLEEYENCSVPEIDMQVDVTFGKKQANAIKTLLGNLEALCDMQRSADRELKRQKQINEEHQKINGELRERVKELDTENNKLLKELYNAHCIISDLSNKVKELEQEIEKINKQLDLDYVEENYIPKQAVIDKIGKLKNEYDKKYDLYMGYKIESREQQDILKQMEILQELLETK